MGRELTDIHMDRKQDLSLGTSNDSQETDYAAPRISEDGTETTDYEVKECTAEASVVNEEQNVPIITETKPPLAGAKKSLVITKKSSPPSKSSPASNVRGKVTVPQPFSLATEKRSPCVTSCCGSAENGNCGITCSRKSNVRISPNAMKSPESHSPLLQRKLWQAVDNKKHLDNEDNWSIASSVAASVRANRFKTTVGSAPTLRSSERAERRKEYYMKLEEKHQALAAEKSQCEARIKEEQEAAIKQMRKNMVVKAKPVPTFYQEGPPAKVELRKLPVTRAKSPNLTRRKSSGDAISSCQNGEGGACSRACRHSMGSLKVDSPLTTTTTTTTTTKLKAPINGQNGRSGSFKLFV